MLWSAVAFAAGVFVGRHACRTDLLWIIAAVLLALSTAYFLQRRILSAFGLALCVVFIAGAVSIQSRGAYDNSARDIRRFANDREIQVTAHVTKEGVWKQKDYGEDVQTIDVETEQIADEGNISRVRAGIRLSIFKTLSHEGIASDASWNKSILRYGQRLQFPAKLLLPRNFRNPGEFDYEAYLAGDGIAALGSAKINDVEVLPGFSGNRFALWRAQIHRSLTTQIAALWPPDQASLVDTIILGDDTLVGKDVLTNFQRTGTYHVLVVSGLKVGVPGLIVFWALHRLRVNEFVASLVTVLFAVFYALLTDVGTPVWRATLMLILYLAARLLYRERSILNTIGAAALVLLSVDPTQLFGASFQLSFLCVLIIGGIGTPLLERTTKPIAKALRNIESTRYDLALSPRLVQLRLDLRMIAVRLGGFVGSKIPLPAISALGRGLVMVFDFFLISILLQAGFVLPMAFYFHRATILSLPANILVVPLTQFIMLASGAAASLSYISLPLARIPAFVTAIALRSASSTVQWMGGFRISDARIATPELWISLLTCSALVLEIIVSRSRQLLVAASFLAVAATGLWISLVPPRPHFHPDLLEVTVIDVGQGDSILVVTPQGRTLLIDAGGVPAFMHSDLDIGEDVVSPYLWTRGISRLDAVAITHAHADHIGGMTAVLSNFHPRELWLGVDSPSPELQRVLQQAKTFQIPIIAHWAGESFQMGGASVRILAPPSGLDPNSSRPNDTSLVMKVSYRRTSALLEGDAERKEENVISEEQPQADLLKVAHHGSSTSTAADFLARVHPRFAVISVGAHNVYGHPRKEIIDRLADAKVGTYRTDTNGAVSFFLDGKNVIPDVLSSH